MTKKQKVLEVAKNVGIRLSSIDKMSNKFGNGLDLLLMLIEKLEKPKNRFVKDGKVGLLCSRSKGVRWACGRFEDQEIQERAIFDEDLIKIIENKSSTQKDVSDYTLTTYGVEAPDLIVEWIPVGMAVIPSISISSQKEYFIVQERNTCYIL